MHKFGHGECLEIGYGPSFAASANKLRRRDDVRTAPDQEPHRRNRSIANVCRQLYAHTLIVDNHRGRALEYAGMCRRAEQRPNAFVVRIADHAALSGAIARSLATAFWY